MPRILALTRAAPGQKGGLRAAGRDGAKRGSGGKDDAASDQGQSATAGQGRCGLLFNTISH